MRPGRFTAIAAAVLAAAIAGCGLGEGEAEEGVATLTVTRDHGAERLLEAESVDPSASETVVRFLDRETDIETEYGGNFVSSIQGLEGTIEDGRTLDWFFYVNGYWSPIGAGESEVQAGDGVWWDYRDWTDAYRVPAVVGSFPEPFLHGHRGEVPPIEVVCVGGSPACEQVHSALAEEGVDAEIASGLAAAPQPADTLRILVGPWERVRADRTARLLERGPSESGVYARVGPCRDGGIALTALDERAEPVAVHAEAGWVAAMQSGDDEPTWVVSGTGPDGVADAAALLDAETLADHYAIASTGSGSIRLPAAEGAPASAAEGCPAAVRSPGWGGGA